MKNDQPHRVLHVGSAGFVEASLNLITEEPLAIRVQGNPYTVIMRTPGEELAHAAGFCLGEGLVASPDDITTLAYCEDDVNVVTVTLTPERQALIQGHLQRRGYISQTSCGICGKELVHDLSQKIPRIEASPAIEPTLLVSSLSGLSDRQPLRERTRAAHGAVLCDDEGRVLASAEDVGRHNALDKVVGELFLEKKLDRVAFLVLSSRISYELVQKAAMAGIPVVAAVSRPTALAVDLAKGLDMALVCEDGHRGLYVFCGSHRLIT